MVELRRRFPGFRSVTFGAVFSELILVRLLVAGTTFASQTEEGLVEIFYPDLRTRGSCDPRRGMALLALQHTMFPFQDEADLLAVIKAVPVQGDKVEFRTSMFRMAARTIRPAGGTPVCV